MQMQKGGDVVLRVGISYPGNPGRQLQEWLVLGSQRLTELRDSIYCRSDRDTKHVGMDRPSGEAKPGHATWMDSSSIGVELSALGARSACTSLDSSVVTDSSCVT